MAMSCKPDPDIFLQTRVRLSGLRGALSGVDPTVLSRKFRPSGNPCTDWKLQKSLELTGSRQVLGAMPLAHATTSRI